MVSLVWVSVEDRGLREGVRYRGSSGLGKKGDYCLVKIGKKLNRLCRVLLEPVREWVVEAASGEKYRYFQQHGLAVDVYRNS